MKQIYPLVVAASLLSGCWLANDLSDCEPTTCQGTCVEGICVVIDEPDDGLTDDVSTADASDAEGQDAPPDLTPCTSHLECDQTAQLEGTELCVEGFCQQVLFDEGAGTCDELFVGDGVTLDSTPDNTIIIPTVTSITGDAAGFNQRRTNNGFKLAVEFANKSGALGERKVVLVFCDDAADAEVSKAIASQLLDRTNAISYLGSNLANGVATAVTTTVVARDVLAFANSSEITYAKLSDNDLAYRNMPSDQFSVDGIQRLLERYEPSDVGLIYRTDDPVLDVLGLTLAQQISPFNVATAKYDATGFEGAVQSIRSLTSGLRPVEVLIVIGAPADIPAIVAAYRDALPDRFTSGTPRFLTSSFGTFAIPLLLELSFTPNRAEGVLGAAASGQAFRDFYTAKYGTMDEVAPLLFDSAMLLMMTHVAAPNATTGTELAEVLRSRISVDDPGATEVVSYDPTAFLSAAQALSRGENVRYITAGGGVPAIFDENGDMPYTTIAGTFPTGDLTQFQPTRVLAGTTWIDLCDPSAPFAACVQGFTDELADPGQTCVPPAPDAPLPLGTCLPNCDLASPSCPDPIFTCGNLPMPAPQVDLCIPPI